MSDTKKRSVLTYHERLKRRGIVRLTVRVQKDDVALVRGVVRALGDPKRETEARIFLRRRFGSGKAAGLKVLLAAAPLEGIKLTRPNDHGREIDL